MDYNQEMIYIGWSIIILLFSLIAAIFGVLFVLRKDAKQQHRDMLMLDTNLLKLDNDVQNLDHSQKPETQELNGKKGGLIGGM